MPQVIPENENIPSDHKEGDYRISLQSMPGDGKIRSDDSGVYERIRPPLMPDDDRIPCHDHENHNQIPPKNMSDDEKLPSEKKESIEQIPQNYEIPYSETFLFDETEEILRFNKNNDKVSGFAYLVANTYNFVNCFFSSGADSNLFREDFLEAELLKVIQAKKRLSLKEAPN